MIAIRPDARCATGNARVEKLKSAEAAIAPLAMFLACDAVQGVSGTVFAVRANEMFLMSHDRPRRSVQCSEG
jgi:hypothetical protein